MSSWSRDAVSWAERAWDRRIREVRRLRGGWTSTILGLTAHDGERAVLRLMTKEPWRSHSGGLLSRESLVQRQLADAPVPAPETIAVDPEGSAAGTPAHLMSWLPGSVELVRADDRLLRALAQALVEIHRFDPGAARPRAYQSWAHPAKRVIPGWTRHPDLWTRAFTLLEQDPPAYRGSFLHRDFHLGNILWDGDRVTGVVDWVETSWGPAELDVAHATTYLVMLHGAAAAQRFAAFYRDLSGGTDGSGQRRHWHVMDVVGYLPDPTKVIRTWRDLGRDVSDQLARDRIERHLASVLSGAEDASASLPWKGRACRS